ncbi:MAG: nucleotidyltransferase [Phycisphaerae bacterium]|nr:nucleotidyltransferase [Phycisphaerae bacterium]
MDSILQILRRLRENNVEFVVIGGIAAVLHGSSLVTEDLDVACPLSEANAQRLHTALDDLHPVHRMTPTGKPLTESPAELAKFQNLYLRTDLGQVDFLGEVAGIGGYEEVRENAIVVDIAGVSCRVLSLPALIRAKEAMGRERDWRAVVQLQAILDRVRQKPGEG